MIFKYKYREKFYCYEKLSNGQTAYIGFNYTDYFNYLGYNVVFAIADKKKHIKAWLNAEPNDIDLNQTGRCGVEGLLWAKRKLKEFEEEVVSGRSYPQRIELYGADSRRMKVYRHFLKDYTFSPFEHVLYKKFNF